MRSMFEVQAFGGRSVPSYASPMLGTVRLAQAEPTPEPAPTESDVPGLTRGIEGLLKQLPAELLGSYNAKYQQCQAQLEGGAVGVAAGVKCLYKLYNELKDILKNGPPKSQPPTPAAGDFPFVPVLVGSIGLIVLIWGLSKL